MKAIFLIVVIAGFYALALTAIWQDVKSSPLGEQIGYCLGGGLWLGVISFLAIKYVALKA